VSWSGGSRIFNSVSEAIEKHERVEIPAVDLVSELVKALKREGWDPEEYGVGGLNGDSIVRRALERHGVVEKCLAEHEVNPWQCEGRAGHYPTTNHHDYQGNTWSDEEKT
jgi:hypothetical protein